MKLSKLQKQVLSILRKDARISFEDLADRLNSTANAMETMIHDFETTGVIKSYKAIVNDSVLAGSDKVEALIEVRLNPEKKTGFDTIAKRIYQFDCVVDHYLISGSYDFLLVVEGQTIQDIGRFVADKLSTLGNIQQTATHFILKKYKENGTSFDRPSTESRLAITP